MKIHRMQLGGAFWVAVVLILYVAQSPRFRPPGLLGQWLKAFFDALTAAYLH